MRTFNILKIEKMLGREEIDEEALKQYKDFIQMFRENSLLYLGGR